MDYLVPPEREGQRLREVLRGAMGVSYSAMKSAKWNGRIRLNGAAATVDTRIHAGDTVTFLPKEGESPYPLRPYAVPLEIPYQDEWLMIVNKPAPLASQSSQGHPDDSLENAVYAYLRCPESFLYRPVNRLDKGTSGLMAIALDAHTQHRMQQLLHTPDFERVYLVITDGAPKDDAGVIDLPIGKAPGATIRRCVDPAGKKSVTHYQVLARFENRALVRLKLETGRTHQIRVHLSALGCPVAGDFLYGAESPLLPGRFALHASELTLRHPHTGALIHLCAPLPPEVQALLPQGFEQAR